MCSTAIQEESGGGSHRCFPGSNLILGLGLLNPMFRGHHLSILPHLPSDRVDFVLFIGESGWTFVILCTSFKIVFFITDKVQLF